MEISFLGKEESVNSCLPGAVSPFQHKFRQLRGRQRAFLKSAGFLLLLIQNNFHAQVAHLGEACPWNLY